MNKPSKQNQHKPSAMQLNTLLSDEYSEGKENKVDYKKISIPGAPLIEEMFDVLEPQNESAINKHGFGLVKIHKADKKTLLEGDMDLFVFKEPSIEKQQEKKTILTQIPTSFENKKESKKETVKENIFLNQAKPKNSNTTTSEKRVTTKAKQVTAALPKNNSKKQQPAQKPSSFIIATLFLLILLSTVFVLQAANILDFNHIASLLDNTNYSAEVTNETTTISGMINSTML